MIQQILDFLFEQPEFPSPHADYVVNVIVREPVLIHVFFKNGVNYFVKAAKKPSDAGLRLHREFVLDEAVEQKNVPSSLQRIGREFDALVVCSEWYPDLVPAPILFRESDHHVVLVTQGIKHSVVNLDAILQAKRDSRRQIQHFLIGKERMMQVVESEPHDQILVFEQGLSYLPPPLLESIQRIRQAHDWDTLLARLPAIPQHGDLAVNNIGLTHTGFVLFDWEDYAYTKLPGFDLSILLASGCDFNTSKLVSLVENEINLPNTDSFLQPIIEGIGIKVPQFYDLMLIHFIMFHQLKSQHGYSTEIIKSTENLLQVLSLSIIHSQEFCKRPLN